MMNCSVDGGNRIDRLGKGSDEEGLNCLAQQQELDPFPPAEGERPWADLSTDTLTEIIARLSFEDRLRTVALVCTGWRNATFNPSCWRNIDMEGWFEKRVETDYSWGFDFEPVVERLVQKAVDLSCGHLEELRTRHCTDATIDYIADRCPSLSVLSVSKSLFTSDRSVANLASCCPKLKVLDVGDCYYISDQALEAVGQNCKSLAWLSRNMIFRNLVLENLDVINRLSSNVPGGDEEAIVVSEHVVNLKHLEMMKTSLSNKGFTHLALAVHSLRA